MKSNISKLNSHQLIIVEEKLEKTAKEFADRFDHLAVINHRVGRYDRRVRKMTKLSIAIAKISIVRAKISKEIKEAHTLTDEEYSLIAAG